MSDAAKSQWIFEDRWAYTYIHALRPRPRLIQVHRHPTVISTHTRARAHAISQERIPTSVILVSAQSMARCGGSDVGSMVWQCEIVCYEMRYIYLTNQDRRVFDFNFFFFFFKKAAVILHAQERQI